MNKIVALTLGAVMASASVAAYSGSDAVEKPARVELKQVAVKAAAKIPQRNKAFRAAKRQKGDPYRYGATGPNAWDCSGLVQWAYRQAGVSLGRTTSQMLNGGKLTRVSKARAKYGDLVFFGSGHVELYSSKTFKFGARRSGTRIGWTRYYGSPRFFHVKGANKLVRP